MVGLRAIGEKLMAFLLFKNAALQSPENGEAGRRGRHFCEDGGRDMELGILRLRKTVRAANCLTPLRIAGLRLVFFLPLMFSAGAWATTYYVSSSSGNDSNSASLSAPWQTIAHVNGQTFQPGDSVLFKRGDVWNESLVPASSGSSGNPITFDAYGTGAAPNLTGYYAVPTTAWVQVTGNAWKAPLPTTYATVNFCLFGSVWGQKVAAATSNLIAQRNFYLANGYIYIFSAGNPSTFYGAPIVPMALSNVPVINVNGQSWLTFQHFQVNWFDEYGVYVQGNSDHLVFANMEADSMIPQGTQPLGFYVNESAPGPGDIKIYNAEVRENDYGWGQANDRNLLGRFNTQTFTLARLARTQNYFLRLYDGSSPPKYSRYSAALHVDYPL